MNVAPAEIKNLSSDEVDEIIKQYFTEEEWRDTPEFEKLRNRLMFVNYMSYPELAHIIPKPPFLQKSEDVNSNKSKKSNKKPSKRRGVKGREDNDDIEKRLKKSLKQNQNSSIEVRRNPKRSTSTSVKSYYEEDAPDDDRYIFCDTCQKDVLDYCDTCGMLVVVKDVSCPVGTPDRARKTVPPIFEIRPSTLHGLGVFVKIKIPRGIQLGPYEGTLTRVSSTTGYSWKLRNGKLVDAGDETVSNWMRYVNCAPHVSAQNLVAFQYRGELFYRTARAIQEGEELLVYYGNSYAKELGIEPKEYFNPAIDLQQKPFYLCKYCQVGLSTAKFRDCHEKHCGLKNKITIYTGITFACQHCQVLCTAEDARNKHEKFCRMKPRERRNQDCKEEKLKRFKCELCDYGTNRKNDLKRHRIVHNKENATKYSCNNCEFKTIYKVNLIKHQQTHIVTSMFICNFCQKSFNLKVNLDSHYVAKHRDKYDVWKQFVNSKIYECSSCSFCSIKLIHFKNHLKTHNKSVTSDWYHCQICSFKCIKKSNFLRHLRIHTGQLPFLCTGCNKKFSMKDSLNQHIVNQHFNIPQLMATVTCKIHYCSNCSYKTANSTSFKRHKKHCKN